MIKILSTKLDTSNTKKKGVSAVQPNGTIKYFASSGFTSASNWSTNWLLTHWKAASAKSTQVPSCHCLQKWVLIYLRDALGMLERSSEVQISLSSLSKPLWRDTVNHEEMQDVLTTVHPQWTRQYHSLQPQHHCSSRVSRGLRQLWLQMGLHLFPCLHAFLFFMKRIAKTHITYPRLFSCLQEKLNWQVL